MSTTPTYGTHGQFLASLATLSLLSITSRYGEDHGCTLVLHRSRVIARRNEGSDRDFGPGFSHGTVVTVHDLFGNLPVRVKDRAFRMEDKKLRAKDLDGLRRRLLALSLAYGKSIAINVTDNEQYQTANSRFKLSTKGLNSDLSSKPARRSFDLERIAALFHQVYRPTDSGLDHWVVASGQTIKFCARVALFLEPVPTKHLQFISLGMYPLDIYEHHSILFDEVNRIFTNSSFGVQEADESQEEETARRASKRLRDRSRGPDKHPMYYIRIDFVSGNSQAKMENEDLGLVRSERVIEEFLELLRPLLWQLLKQHGFQPRNVRRKRQRRSQSPQPEDFEAEPSQQMDNSIDPVTLASAAPSKFLTRSMSPMRRPLRDFSDWSRIKSSNRSCLKEFGLPHRQRIDKSLSLDLPGSSSVATDQELSASSDTLSVEDDCCGHQETTCTTNDVPTEGGNQTIAEHSRDSHTQIPIEDEAPEGIAPDQVVAWKDPTTGRTVNINSRTGLVMPHDDSQKNATGLTSRPRRSIRHGTKETSIPEQSDQSWLNGVLNDWKNPVFANAEEPIPSIQLDIDESDQIRNKNSLFEDQSEVHERLRRSDLATAEVIGQVDNKFILISMDSTSTSGKTGYPPIRRLVLVDQHAADERCRVEQLLQEICDPSATEVIGGSNSKVPKPLGFDISQEEAQLLEQDKEFFFSWGIGYEIKQKKQRTSESSNSRPSSATSNRTRNYEPQQQERLLLITHLPRPIAERCRLDPRILIDMIRTEIWKRHDDNTSSGTSTHFPPSSSSSSSSKSTINPTREQETNNIGEWINRLPSIPRSLLDLINSRACRSAIMFNDVLGKEECEQLIQRLARCYWPFVCAHGRRSCVVLGSWGGGGGGVGSLDGDNGV